MPTNKSKDTPKTNDNKKAPKDLPVRPNDADKVKGGAGNAGEQHLR
jgi:hypothetical protein